DQRSFLVRHVVWKSVGELCGNGDIVGKCTINGRRAEETDILTQVVMPGSALLTRTIWYAWLDRHAFTNSALGNICSHCDNHTRRLVTENERLTYNIWANSTMLVVMDIGSTDPDRLDLDQYVFWTGLRHGPLFHADIVWGVQHRCSISHGCISLLFQRPTSQSLNQVPLCIDAYRNRHENDQRRQSRYLRQAETFVTRKCRDQDGQGR